MTDKNSAPNQVFSYVDFIVAIVVILITILLVINIAPAVRAFSGGKCGANLDQIGKSLKLYTIDFGRSIRYPAADGSGFLATLYRENVLVESSVYLCPATPDENAQIDLAAIRGEGNGVGPFSYTGRKNLNQRRYPGIFNFQRDAALTTVSGDDWNDGQVENHQNGDVILFLFLDGHSDGVYSRGANFDNYSFNFNPLAN